MSLNDELKLAIYESSLDTKDKSNLINIIESTTDENILLEIFNILESSKEEADELEKLGKEERQFAKDDIKQSIEAGDIRFNEKNNPFTRAANAYISGKYGSQYEKMSPEEKRKRDIKTGEGRVFDMDRHEKKVRGEKPKKNNEIRYQCQDSKYSNDVEDMFLYAVRHNKLSELKDAIADTNRKDRIIRKLNDKYGNDEKVQKKIEEIRSKYESTLEAFKEGILTESEVLEIFAEANATTKFIHQSREEAKKENSDIKKREKEITDKIDKFDSVANTTPSDSVRAIARKKANDLLKERYKLNDKRDENEKIINVKTSKDTGKEVAKTISDLKKQIKVNEQNGKKTDTLKNEINNIIKKSKHSGNLDKKVMNREFDIDKNRVERKPGAFV